MLDYFIYVRDVIKPCESVELSRPGTKSCPVNFRGHRDVAFRLFQLLATMSTEHD